MSIAPGSVREEESSAGQGIRSFRQSLLAMLGLSSVVMMVAIDQTVVGTALPSIVADLHRFDLYEWVATSYLLTSVITVPIFGRLGDWLGRKPLIVIAIVLFTVASALCGFAQTMPMLIACRALQGIGGGMLVGTCFASIPDLFPDPVVRLRWQVLFSSAFGLANAVGPSLGGFLSQHYGWRSAFLVNIPVGVVSLYLAAKHLPHIRHARFERLNADWKGACLITVALGSLQLLVEAAGSTGSHAGLYAAVAVLSMGLLVRQERRAPNPVIPPGLLKDRATLVLLVLSLLMGVAMFVLLFYVPLLLQGGLGLDAGKAGIVVTPMVVCITVGTITNTRIVTRLEKPNLLLYLGFGLLGVSCAAIASVGAGGASVGFVVAMVMAGVGIGFVMPNLTVFVQQVAGKTRLGIATALIQSARMVGGMLGTAMAGTMARHLYRAGLEPVLTAKAAAAPGHWTLALQDPQTLMSAQAAADFAGHANHAGFDGEAMLGAARAVLVHALQTSLFGVALLMAAACVIVRLLPLIPITSIAASRQQGAPE
ncbi:sugar (and other) transporter family protein [Paraburkholderia xenovorans LB400]|uniref:Major facilitator superfamily (MFS) drug efflux pump, EmrB/QacA subfamily n=1 Tax=Paraburkholderia xenovorans (strain LB400) TaxID=266265 RepID=Q13XQ7_PARXL|nr:MFS transporter [Paraburkholderia xenovorans]ABE31132.1 major facilitator superfamily (MFS) drug efflux pump, EmrB/QacA subfamily [Paraburkholderia xenovorans LB400]AIP33158.1 sugar (and other) transporter family protein [Paraburkholderia xenovorans LB400]